MHVLGEEFPAVLWVCQLSCFRLSAMYTYFQNMAVNNLGIVLVTSL